MKKLTVFELRPEDKEYGEDNQIFPPIVHLFDDELPRKVNLVPGGDSILVYMDGIEVGRIHDDEYSNLCHIALQNQAHDQPLSELPLATFDELRRQPLKGEAKGMYALINIYVEIDV